MRGVLDLVFYGWVAAMAFVPIRHAIRRRHIAPDSAEADEDLLDSIHTHWVLHSQLDDLTARRMRAELADHFVDVRRSGGRAGDVVGCDLAAFADEWADSHDAVGPWAGLPWRVVGFGFGLFAMAMMVRTLDLFADGRSDYGYLQAAVSSLAVAVPIAACFPFLGRLPAGPALHGEFRQLALLTAIATPFAMAFLGLTIWLFSGDNAGGPQPGRWSWSVMAMAVAGVLAWFAIERSDPVRPSRPMPPS